MPRSLENIGTMWVFLPALENKRPLKNIISSQVIVYFFFNDLSALSIGIC